MVELSESQQVKINNYSNHLLEAKARITQLNQSLREFKKMFLKENEKCSFVVFLLINI